MALRAATVSDLSARGLPTEGYTTTSRIAPDGVRETTTSVAPWIEACGVRRKLYFYSDKGRVAVSTDRAEVEKAIETGSTSHAETIVAAGGYPDADEVAAKLITLLHDAGTKVAPRAVEGRG